MSARLGRSSLRPHMHKKVSERSSPGSATRTAHSLIGLKQAHLRLQHLYAISKLFTNSENIEQPLDPALVILTKTLPLRSAILIEIYDQRCQMTVWSSEGADPKQMSAVEEHARVACSYLVGTVSSESLPINVQPGTTWLPRPTVVADGRAENFINIPLVVARRPPFGALQLEGARRLDEMDLMFINAIANQLAIALDRHRAWQRDISRLEYAEERRGHAEATRAAAEAARLVAEQSREKYALLAAENSKLYEQAQQAVRAREEILTMVSHDLKSPLGTIFLTTSLLPQEGTAGDWPKGLPAAVSRIRRSANSMLRLIEDLLDFASIEAGHLAIKCQPQEVGSLIQETLTSFDDVAREKQLRLTAEVEPQLPTVLCDRERILQVLSNLVSNACKVTAEAGQITLRVAARGHDISFAVSDTGPGISEDDAKHLFERYWRSSNIAYKGTGLGLAIVSAVVSAHRGKIWVESELGHGATLFFTLPTRAAEPA
jgi:signal transduction histidine kinase